MHYPTTYAKFFFCVKKEDETPMMNGVGASSRCSEPDMECGSNGMMGNMYCKGYSREVKDKTHIVSALRSREWTRTLYSRRMMVNT